MWYMDIKKNPGQTLDISPKLYKDQLVHGKILKIIKDKKQNNKEILFH